MSSSLSIIIPTYNERNNTTIIANEISQSLGDLPYEILFVDDSTDDTPEILETLSREDFHVRYIHRDKERGLATAVVLGFKEAEGDLLAVIDADMQHPPELLKRMYDGMSGGCDIVIPSRFIPGGSDGGLNVFRKLVSWVARCIGQVSLKSLRKITDATSGVFMFKKSVIEGVELSPIGWKILIEVLVKGHYDQVLEIPYEFKARRLEESKMSMKEQVNYLRHILKLIHEKPSEARFLLFASVGGSGVLVNMLVYYLMVGWTGILALSSVISAVVAMTSNYLLNSRITWKDVAVDRVKSYFKYVLISGAGIGINVMVLMLLSHKAGIHYMIGNLTGIVAAIVWNYYMNSLWTWRSKKR